MSSNVLAAKDVNMSMTSDNTTNTNNNHNTSSDTIIKPDTMSMEYHRQVLQSKMEKEDSKTYVSPSDNIMSPCTAKLSAFRSKQVGKVKPKSLFAQASAKKLEGDGGLLFGSKPAKKIISAPPSGPSSA
ncbi:Spo12 family-domain-containing protein [Cladorrhinum samala]|uniref:Spo12 family-domain-containing protein n=1 Tax=Cladorrhinum samala TaxID=585594 RepID=A0AAV9I1M1_9PEZI|nr:Spo12 family-domain-containing protein [Cladorrhinum samala]